MRLIDADALIAKYENAIANEWNKKTAPISWADAYDCVVADIEDAPTVDIKTEVAREIFAEIEEIVKLRRCDLMVLQGYKYDELKNKYIGGVGE